MQNTVILRIVKLSILFWYSMNNSYFPFRSLTFMELHQSSAEFEGELIYSGILVSHSGILVENYVFW